MKRIVINGYQRTRKGTVIRTTEERYLHKDIHCGRDECRKCSKFKFEARVPIHYLSESARGSACQEIAAKHFLVLDESVLSAQIDVISDVMFGEDVVIMQTSFQSLRPNITLFSKLKELVTSRKFYLFHNELFAPTFRLAKREENPGEYRRALVLEAAEWLQAHWKDVEVIILTNIKGDFVNDTPSDIRILLFEDYVKDMHNCIHLVDKLSLASMDSAEHDEKENSSKRACLYEDYWPLHEVQAQLKAGSLHKGKLRTSQYNHLEGTVIALINGEEVHVGVQGLQNMNRAINEDVVAIHILPKSEWKSKSETIIDENVLENTEDNELVIESKENDKDIKTERPMAKVVAVIKRNWRSYCGVIRERKDQSVTAKNFYFVPVDKKIPFIRIETRQYEKLVGKKILVNIDSWNRDSRYPRGHYVRIIGEGGDKETETSVLLLEHDVPHSEFSAQVLNCLPSEGEEWRPSPDILENRMDLRDTVICSVDPPGCTDIDDALHCKDLGDGTWEVGVHIADVSHFIKPGTAIDKEAEERGTTVYLADRRIDMVPGLLSSNLCSLRGGEERLSFSCIWIMDPKTSNIIETKFTKSIIKSDAALTYAEAQMKIDSKDDNDPVTMSLRRLNSLAKILKAKRIDKGALILASANEIKFVQVESEMADSELAIVEKKHMETNSMVEEFMLLANISVAQRIYETFPEFAVLRRHPKPSASNFEELLKAAKNRGFDIDVSDGKHLSISLDSAVDPKNENLNLMLRMITTRCMSQAVYFCSGALSSDPTLTFLHYGLASEIYTHFTSPIRRYADIMVHRLLAHSIFFENIPANHLTRNKIMQTCEHINMRNMNARRASRASNELHSYLYVKNSKTGVVEELGHVFTLKNNALCIFIVHLSFEVIYPLDPESDWQVNQEEGIAQHLPSKTTIRQFDQVKVQLSIDKSVKSSFKKQIIVKLLSPKIL